MALEVNYNAQVFRVSLDVGYEINLITNSIEHRIDYILPNIRDYLSKSNINNNSYASIR